MLKLKNIKKDYISVDEKVEALKGIDLNFRRNEFVSILGPSGCGKTTLLNIIGGLDKYTSGDLIINGKSTKEYKDSDWDSYRNHSIGFVFQSYNLIPHQSVLSNVELALTLSGVSKSERRKRAIEALNKVGLHDQIKKKPNQMSGGQMQRVAIARALVNDPEILLADEPTGALDSQTSIQIMELLKEVSKDRLVIMVTHNPDLAKEYSTRIIKLLDGKITDDSDPYDGEEIKENKSKLKKTSMSFFTALSLSLNNLMTKKTRTILTSFAGSIGIIGIALILSLSNGINAYINRVQEDTLSSYPIMIQAESVDMSSFITTIMGINAEKNAKHEKDAVYSSSVLSELLNSMTNAQIQTNNLKLFKEFLDSNGENINDYISNIKYSYDLDMNIYVKNPDGKVVKSDVSDLLMSIYEQMGVSSEAFKGTESSARTMQIWQELLSGKEGELIDPLIKEQYDLISGNWPQSKDEVLLIVNENNEVSDLVLFTIGLKSTDDMVDVLKSAQKGEKVDETVESWSYDDIRNLEFKLIPSCEMFQKNQDGSYLDLTTTEKGLDYLYSSDNALTLKISGIIRPNEDAVANSISGSLGFTSALTDYLIDFAKNNETVKAQLENKDQDIILNLPFKNGDEELYTNEEKIELIKNYFSTLSENKKASIYTDITGTAPEDYVNATVEQSIGDITRPELEAQIAQMYSQSTEEGTDTSYINDYIAKMSDDELFAAAREAIAESVRKAYKDNVEKSLSQIPSAQLSQMFDMAVATQYKEKDYIDFFDRYMPKTVSESSYEDNLKALGYVDKDSPSAINIYAKTFNDKDTIADIIEKYNSNKEKDDKITYTDYVALIMSSVSTIINAISYVLVAFVAISLVVSSIMIGIITYISVLERTKEIGVLRAIGASKKDISRVFNAETLIEGFASGAFGIILTLLLNIPINIIVHKLTDIYSLNAVLPVNGAVILVIISMVLTFIAGLIPSGIASKKDPVVALRSE